MTISFIVHGGAWDIPQAEHAAHKAGCKKALLAGWKVLRKGGSALDAVEIAVTIMEDDPTFDAGIGSHLNRAGQVELDAGMMDGRSLQVGAVASMQSIQNPVKVARLLLESEHNMLVGQGAAAYAVEKGFKRCEPGTFVVAREQASWEEAKALDQSTTNLEFGTGPKPGTVGAVAYDLNGDIAAATSTGGTLYKPVGRVGDSPLPGCGYFADSSLAGISTTGHGESIIRVQLARTAADFCSRLHGPAAAKAAISMLNDRVGGLGGLILIDHRGRVGYAHNTPNMARAYITLSMDEPVVAI